MRVEAALSELLMLCLISNNLVSSLPMTNHQNNQASTLCSEMTKVTSGSAANTKECGNSINREDDISMRKTFEWLMTTTADWTSKFYPNGSHSRAHADANVLVWFLLPCFVVLALLALVIAGCCRKCCNCQNQSKGKPQRIPVEISSIPRWMSNPKMKSSKEKLFEKPHIGHVRTGRIPGWVSKNNIDAIHNQNYQSATNGTNISI